MDRYVLVYTVEGDYDAQLCTHNFIAVFPQDATDEDITFALGKNSWDRIRMVQYKATTKKVFVLDED